MPGPDPDGDEPCPSEPSPDESHTGESRTDESLTGEGQPGRDGVPSRGEGPPDGRPADDVGDDDLPGDVVGEAERLTRLARRASDPDEAAAYRRERAGLLADYGFVARVRESEDRGDVLVCHPADWLADETARRSVTAPDEHPLGPDLEGDDRSTAPTAGECTVDPERVADVDRAVEVPLEGADAPDDWESVYEENHAVAEAVGSEHGEVHGENAAAFAEYVSNHYAKPLDAVTAAELQHFREDYYVRNVWPTDEEADALDRSLDLVYDRLSVPRPDAG